MKKSKIILIIIFAILLISGVVIFILFKNGTISLEKKEVPTIIIQKDKDGRTFTQDIWVWKPNVSSKKISYLPDTSNISTKNEVLQIGNNSYITINVKDIETVCNNLKVLYGRDGSFIVQIMKDCKLEELQSMLGIEDCIWEDDVLLTRTTFNGAQIIATVIDDVAIVSKVYFDSEVYSTILNSYKNGLYYKTIDSANKAIVSEFEELPVDNTYLPTAGYDKTELAPYEFRYADGYLYIQHDLENIHNITESYEIRMNVMSNDILTKYYESDNIYYMESDKYTIAIVTISTNDNVIMFGKGNEARANILHLLKDE